ncbi:MAG TPA: cytochrome c oxidase assembly protein [Marmoricola sp.]|nr:cytochrome c oxidase assembly protein [Marmoricola sp.]
MNAAIETAWSPYWVPSAPPSLATMLAPHLQPVPVIPVLALIVAALYLMGAIRLWRNGRRWSVLATVSFVAGCLVTAVVMGAGIEGYGFRLFSAFMFQQLTLMMAVPPLLVLGRPGTLLLRATPHAGLGRLVLRGALWGLRSALGRLLLHPALSIALFLLSFYGLYLGSLADRLLSSWGGHVGLELAFLLAGVLFTVPVLSSDPLPRRQRQWGRAVDMFVEMPLHAFFGVIVMMASAPLVATFSRPPASWGVDVMSDQGIAGGLAWSYGELPSLVLLLIVFARWEREERHAHDTPRADGRTTVEAELDDYNGYLERLRAHDG